MNKIFIALGVAMMPFISNAGAEITVKLNTGDQFKWQFFDMGEASEFLADRIDSGRCNPDIVSIRVRSRYIEGMDDPKNKFSWYHGIRTGEG